MVEGLIPKRMIFLAVEGALRRSGHIEIFAFNCNSFTI